MAAAVVHKRRRARELAMQVLFLWDANNARDDELGRQALVDASVEADDAARREAMEMAGGAWENRTLADPWVERIAPQWPVRRQPGVDRAILRLAIWELTSTPTPPKAVIDEAIELAKAFSTEQSPGFVNGVLDAVLRDVRALKDGSGLGVQQNPPAEAASPPEP